MDIRALLHQQAVRYGAKTALVFKEETVSFADLETRVEALAAGLQRLGVSHGDRVAVFLPNAPEYVFSYLACFLLGAVVVPLDYMLKADELRACLDHAGCCLLIAQPRQDVDVFALKSELAGLKTLIVVHPSSEAPLGEDVHPWEAAATDARGFIPAQVSDRDPALIMYTSGTTGRPKGILLNYRHLEGSPRAMEHFVDLNDRDVKLAAIPFSHIGGFIYIQNALIFGITLVIMERFNPYEFLRLVQEHKVTCFHIVPAMYTALLSLKQLDRFDLSSLRWVVVFGAPSSPDILERFHRHCPNARLLNGWGMTETCPPNTVTPMDSGNIASVGKPSPMSEIRIVDEAGQTLPAGETGEILIRGWIVMDGYYRDPDATAAVMDQGWLRTGDLGRFDAEGFLYIVGRKKEMIKVAGQIVYAPEVEAALCKHPAVLEAAVIGVADDLRGEAVKAFVVPRAEGLTAEDLRYFAREHLAHFKVPQTIELRADLPKNRVGKIDKELLKQEMAA